MDLDHADIMLDMFLEACKAWHNTGGPRVPRALDVDSSRREALAVLKDLRDWIERGEDLPDDPR